MEIVELVAVTFHYAKDMRWVARGSVRRVFTTPGEIGVLNEKSKVGHTNKVSSDFLVAMYRYLRRATGPCNDPGEKD